MQRKAKEYLVPAEHGTHITLEFIQQLFFIMTGISELLMKLQQKCPNLEHF